MENSEKAISASKELSAYEGNGHRIVNHHSEYLNGELYVVGFETPEGEPKSNYVYIERGNITVCKNPTILNEFVSRKSKKYWLTSIIEPLEGIAGIIGLIVTFTIVWLLVKNPNAEIPQILSAALTTILGFYFGSKTK